MTTPNLLGIGLYTPAEAAIYARVSVHTMNRWLFGSTQSAPAVRSQLEGTDERFVTFLDLVQSLAIRSIRVTRKIPLQKIREAVDFAQEEFGIQYPLARRHAMFLKGDNLVINSGNQESKRYVEATGRHKRATLFGPIAEPFLEDLAFDSTTGLATVYRAFRHDDCEIRLDPNIRFGEPIVANCGYSAQALWDAYRTEGSIKAAAKAFGVTESEVDVACRYFDFILTKNAA